MNYCCLEKKLIKFQELKKSQKSCAFVREAAARSEAGAGSTGKIESKCTRAVLIAGLFQKEQVTPKVWLSHRLLEQSLDKEAPLATAASALSLKTNQEQPLSVTSALKLLVLFSLGEGH